MKIVRMKRGTPKLPNHFMQGVPVSLVPYSHPAFLEIVGWVKPNTSPSNNHGGRNERL